MYASPLDLAARESWSDLAQIAAPDAPDVDGVLLELALTPGSDLSAYSADSQAAAAAAIGRLKRALDDAMAIIDAYIGKRHALPLTGPVPAILATSNLDLALYRLFGGDERYRAAQSTMHWLGGVSSGDLDIPGASRAEDSGSAEGAMATAPAPRFSRAALSGV